MGRVEYTQDQIAEYMDIADEKGIGPAMRELGYPGSHHTAAKWYAAAGRDIPNVNYLQRKAKALGDYYSDREELAAVQSVIERVTEALEVDSLSPDDINKLSNSLQRAIQTANLIKGKSTTITETHTKDGTDLAVFDLLNAEKAKNALKEKTFESHS
jgi:hypothetical protein